MERPKKVTRDGRPIAGWILKANPDVFDVEAYFERCGVVTGWTLKQSYLVDLMEEGDPCFLYQSGGDGQPPKGIIARGEVTGEPGMSWANDTTDWKDEGRARAVVPYAPVALLPLADPIPRETLLEHPVLREMQLIKAPQMGNPVVLRHDELEALEALCGDVIEPTEEQLARLAEEDGVEPGLWFALVTGDASYGVESADDRSEADGAYSLIRVDPETDEATEVGRFESITAAVETLEDVAREAGRNAPIIDIAGLEARLAQDDDSSGAEPEAVEALAVFSVDEVTTVMIARTGENAFDAREGDTFERELVGTWPDLGQAITAVARLLDEVETEEA